MVLGDVLPKKGSTGRSVLVPRGFARSMCIATAHPHDQLCVDSGTFERRGARTLPADGHPPGFRSHHLGAPPTTRKRVARARRSRRSRGTRVSTRCPRMLLSSDACCHGAASVCRPPSQLPDPLILAAHPRSARAVLDRSLEPAPPKRASRLGRSTRHLTIENRLLRRRPTHSRSSPERESRSRLIPRRPRRFQRLLQSISRCAREHAHPICSAFRRQPLDRRVPGGGTYRCPVFQPERQDLRLARRIDPDSLSRPAPRVLTCSRRGDRSLGGRASFIRPTAVPARRALAS